MKFNHLLTVLVILSIHTRLLNSTTQCEGVAYPVAALQDTFLYQYYMMTQTNVTAVSVCATICARLEYCASFFHHQEKGRCHYHYSVIQDPTGAVSYPGFKYYVVSVEDIIPRKFPTSLRMVCLWMGDFQYVVDENRGVEVCLKHSQNHQLDADSARVKCAFDGGRLLEIDTVNKTTFIKELFNNYLNYGSTHIGGTLAGGVWVWNWDPDKPIEHFDWGYTNSQQPDGDGPCMRLSQTAYYTWADGDCSFKARYMCEVVL